MLSERTSTVGQETDKYQCCTSTHLLMNYSNKKFATSVSINYWLNSIQNSFRLSLSTIFSHNNQEVQDRTSSNIFYALKVSVRAVYFFQVFITFKIRLRVLSRDCFTWELLVRRMEEMISGLIFYNIFLLSEILKYCIIGAFQEWLQTPVSLFDMMLLCH